MKTGRYKLHAIMSGSSSIKVGKSWYKTHTLITGAWISMYEAPSATLHSGSYVSSLVSLVCA